MEKNKPAILLRKFLHNDLTAEEQTAFDNLRKNDPSFAEEVDAAVFIAARQRLDAKQRWSQLPVQEKETKQTATIRRLPLRWMAVAASLLLVGMVAYYLWPSENINDLVAQQLSQHHPSPVMVMGEAEQADRDWRAGVKAYQEGRYELVIPLLEKLIAKKLDKPETHFYLGLSYLYISEPAVKKAVFHFEKAKNQNAVKYGEQSDWYTALAWLSSGEQDKAIPILESIEKRDGWKSGEAKVILDKIK